MTNDIEIETPQVDEPTLVELESAARRLGRQMRESGGEPPETIAT